MTKTKRAIFSLLLSLIVLISALVFPASITHVSAEETANVVSAYEEQNVMDDLEGMSVDGSEFDVKDYSFDVSKRTQVLMLVEFCYSFYEDRQNDYGLYLYVWNPQGLHFDTDNALNSVTLRAGDNDAASFKKLRLIYLNQCEEQDYEGLFYKFRIDLSDELKSSILQEVKSDERQYYVGEIELVCEGKTSADSSYVGMQFTYSGFAAGYGSNADAESTLTCDTEQREALRLDVNSTYYYPEGTYSDGVTRDVLQSVYFSVPDSLIETYGEMSAVHATWLDARTAPILVTGNSTIYDTIYPFLGEEIDGGTRENFSQRAFQYSIIANLAVDELKKDDEYAPFGGYFAYNPYYGYDADTPSNYVNSYDTLVRKLSILFFADNGDAGNHVISSEDLLGSDTVPGWFETYTEQHGGELVNGRYSRDLFSEVASSFEDITIKASDTYRLTDNIVDNSAWNALFGNKVQSENYISVSAIQAVSSSDIDRYDKSEFCDKFYISEEDYDDFCEFVDEAENKREPETVYLFRYKQSEYIAAQATEYERTTEWVPFVGDFGRYSYIDLNAYFAQMWVQLDFDVIDVSFSNGTQDVVIPVAMSPMDIAFDGNPPVNWLKDDGLELWQIILAVIALIIVIIILAPLLPYLLKFIGWILLLPFRLISWIISLFTKKNE